MDHLPLYRQLQRFKREKIPIASSTLEGWARQSLKLIDILYKQLLDDTKSKGYLQADETPIKVLDKNKKGRTHQGYYWVYHNPIDKTVFFDYQPGRSEEHTSELQSRGHIVCRLLLEKKNNVEFVSELIVTLKIAID